MEPDEFHSCLFISASFYAGGGPKISRLYLPATDDFVNKEFQMSQIQNDRRMLGALLRIPFQVTVARIYEGLTARGYTDLRPAHFAIFQLIDPEGSRITELAERAQITKQSMGNLVDHVEACGYIKRLPDPSDRRAKIVRLTERGWALDSAAREILRQTEAEWAERLGEGRMAELKQILKDLITLIEG
ncbi:MAG: MarR family winged helix-turn-helix transcriptional regulator [Anaerolineales bacterium]